MILAVAVLFFIALWIGQAQSQCTVEQLENNLGPTDMEEAGGLVSMGVVVNSQAQGPVTGIFFSIGPGPFFFRNNTENFGPGLYVQVDQNFQRCL